MVKPLMIMVMMFGLLLMTAGATGGSPPPVPERVWGVVLAQDTGKPVARVVVAMPDSFCGYAPTVEKWEKLLKEWRAAFHPANSVVPPAVMGVAVTNEKGEYRLLGWKPKRVVFCKPGYDIEALKLPGDLNPDLCGCSCPMKNLKLKPAR